MVSSSLKCGFRWGIRTQNCGFVSEQKTFLLTMNWTGTFTRRIHPNEAQSCLWLPLCDIICVGLCAPTILPPQDLMGELGKKSLIHVSHAYLVNGDLWEFRIWGWIPESLPNGVSRADVLIDLKNWMGVSRQRQWHTPQNGALWSDLKLTSKEKEKEKEVCWFERDNNENGKDYLNALLKGCKHTSHRGTGNTEK